jgi:hypothetical protein
MKAEEELKHWFMGEFRRLADANGKSVENGQLVTCAVSSGMHTHDLRAALPALIHDTFQYSGRDFRLTDVAGRVVVATRR